MRQRILRAAESAFLRKDFHEVRMEDVAVACAVGKGTLYRYFESKEALFTALLLDGIDLLRTRIEAAVAGSGEPVEKLERVVRASLAYLGERRFLFALLHRREHKPSRADAREWERRRARLARVLEDAVREAMDAGQVRRVDPRITAETLLALLRATDRTRRPSDSLEALASSVFDLFLRGAGTASGLQAVQAKRAARRSRAESSEQAKRAARRSRAESSEQAKRAARRSRAEARIPGRARARRTS
jgi:TetR/AcrR family fatty acid metabolism transcriptional regulator